MSTNPKKGSSRPPVRDRGLGDQGKDHKGNSPNPASTEAPDWAQSLLASVESLNSRLGLLEAGQHRPSYVVAAGGSPAPSESGGVPLTGQAAVARQPNPSRNSAPQKPPKGQSGSGYTRIPNGKLVRNKRPTAKPLPYRQAKNWRSNATANLVSGLKSAGVGPEDPKPTHNSAYREAVIDLNWSKAYYAYVRSSDDPLEVGPWRAQNPPPNWEDLAEESEDEDDTSEAEEGPAPGAPAPAPIAASEAPKGAGSSKAGPTSPKLGDKVRSPVGVIKPSA